MKNTLTIKQAFTLVEVIVTVTILAILSTAAFFSFSDSIPDSRDVQRKSDIAKIETGLQLYKQKRGAYPFPGDTFIIRNNGDEVAKQGLLNNKVTLSTLKDLPVDPYIKIPYSYSVTARRSEYEIAATLENKETSKALLSGDYKSVAKEVLPTIMLAKNGTADTEIHDGVGQGSNNRELFIFNNSYDNLPYTFEDGQAPYSSGLGFSDLLANAEATDYWQNSDYESCNEILEAGKSIGDGEYQILDRDTGALTSTGCTNM